MAWTMVLEKPNTKKKKTKTEFYSKNQSKTKNQWSKQTNKNPLNQNGNFCGLHCLKLNIKLNI